MAAKAIKQNLFIWEGVDKKGARLKGESRSASINLVKAELRRQGINPLKVRKKPIRMFGSHKKRISAKDIAIFTRQLATMMSSGVPLVQSFEIIGRGHDNPSMQDLVLQIKTDVEGGNTLTDAMAKHPLHFDALYCNLIRAGEQAGFLEGLLHKIAIYKEKIEAIRLLLDAGKIKFAGEKIVISD